MNHPATKMQALRAEFDALKRLQSIRPLTRTEFLRLMALSQNVGGALL